MPKISVIDSISRMLEIIKLMARDEGATITEISKKTGIDRWTVKHMIDNLEELNTDGKGLYIQEYQSEEDKRQTIFKVPKNNLWSLTLPGMNLSDDEGLLLALMFSQSEANPMLKDSALGLKKKLNMFKNMQNYRIITVSEAKKIATTQTKAVIVALLNAIKNNQLINLNYKPIGRDVKSYNLIPLGIFRYETGYYLAAQKLPDGSFRTFGLERVVKEPEIITFTGKLPDKIDYTQRLADPFGPFDHIEEFEAVLKFKMDSFYGFLNMELSWPDAVKTQQQKDGSVVLRAKTRSHSGIREFIFKFAGNVEVLEPKWLREEVKQELESALKLYKH